MALHNNLSKPRLQFARPVAAAKPNQRFVPIPKKFKKPKGDLNMDISKIVATDIIERINKAHKMVFHLVGDTGGIYDDAVVQSALATVMEQQITDAAEPDKPSFFYHVGDVVYFNGLTIDYPTQFDEPYKFYPAAIVAIPGNHDGQIQVYKGDQPDNEPSLLGFMENFCASKQQFSGFSSYRKTMNQPWPYWTMNTPYLTVIGLYSNIDGSLDDVNDATQYKWLVNQLKKAPADKCLAISIHHPSYSLDGAHGGYPLIGQKLDEAFAAANRTANIVFSGHVHNYQRFTRTLNDKQIVYSITGAGGYASAPKMMHQLITDPTTKKLIKVPFQTTDKEVVLMSYNETSPGFLKITVDAQFITGEYFINPFDGTAAPAKPFDTYTLDWTKSKLLPSRK